jgi:hypothetical protein
MMPQEFEKLYTNLVVPLAGLKIEGSAKVLDATSTVSVTVSDYQNSGGYYGSGGNLAKFTDQTRAAKDSLVSKFRQVENKALICGGTFPRDFSETSIVKAHSGKGSPWEIRGVLQLVAHFGQESQPSQFDSINKIHDKLKDYCKKWIGLDCNGFVGNYAALMAEFYKKPVGNLGPETYIGMFAWPPYKENPKLRTELAKVKECDVMVWLSTPIVHGHLVIINSLGTADVENGVMIRRKVTVVESLGEGSSTGLRESDFVLTNRIGGVEVKKKAGDKEVTTEGGKVKKETVFKKEMWPNAFSVNRETPFASTDIKVHITGLWI